MAEISETLSTDPFANLSQQYVIGICVFEFVSRVKVQVTLRFEQLIDIISGCGVGITPLGQRQ